MMISTERRKGSAVARTALIGISPILLATAVAFAGAAGGPQTAGTEHAPAAVAAPALSPAQAEEIDKIFAPFAKPDTPGCSVAVLRDGRVVFARGYGLADLEHDVPITPETVFEAGSVAKQFTAASLLLLAAEGKLSLEDDVRVTLPEVPDFGRPITLRHLLTHTSGLRDQWNLLNLAGRPTGLAVHTMEEILHLVSRQRELNFMPGDDHLYCNTGYALAAWIVLRASGRSLADFTRERIFEPLGMDRTRWRDDFTAVVKGRATAYAADDEGRFHQNMPFTMVYGNGGLLTTPAELLKWAENFWNPRILGREALDLMETPGRLNDGTELAYALGLRRETYRGLSEVSHGGATAGYRAFLARYPARHTAVALLGNHAGLNPVLLSHKVVDIVLAGRFKDAPKPRLFPVGAAELRKKEGLFINPRNEAVIRLESKNGKLLLTEGKREQELVPVGRRRFLTAAAVAFEFQAGKGDEPDRWRRIPANGDPPSTYERATPAEPSPDKLPEYTGRYFCPELEVFYSIEVADERLVLSLRPMILIPLAPTDEDGFMSETGSVYLRFRRDEAGRVEGFSLSSSRVIRIRFTRE
ncbi:MAG: serine hydrolase [Candidatus Aminicenantes bacterium]|nr:serine hydrolase [Candidatus Aminicenantes bacterium]